MWGTACVRRSLPVPQPRITAPTFQVLRTAFSPLQPRNVDDPGEDGGLCKGPAERKQAVRFSTHVHGNWHVHAARHLVPCLRTLPAFATFSKITSRSDSLVMGSSCVGYVSLAMLLPCVLLRACAKYVGASQVTVTTTSHTHTQSGASQLTVNNAGQLND